MKCPYRIYPAWFGGDESVAMEELARGSAKRLDATSYRIDVTGHGFDRRGGHYLDFTVTYISTRSTSCNESNQHPPVSSI